MCVSVYTKEIISGKSVLGAFFTIVLGAFFFLESQYWVPFPPLFTHVLRTLSFRVVGLVSWFSELV